MSTNSIHTTLQQDIENADRLLAIILAERKALAANDSEDLQSLAKSKQTLAGYLEANNRIRNALLEQHRLAAGIDGIESYISQLSGPEHNLVQETWNSLQQLLGQCQEENRVNGRILDTSQRRIKQAIALLHGQAQSQELYGRAGKPVSGDSGHSLTRA